MIEIDIRYTGGYTTDIIIRSDTRDAIIDSVQYLNKLLDEELLNTNEITLIPNTYDRDPGYEPMPFYIFRATLHQPFETFKKMQVVWLKDLSNRFKNKLTVFTTK